ncbi:MAG: hypothetical protein J6C77_02400 [Muribaculaceae bacterium]|nr:hypothetical protein [Muribaculaceae bacterium]
MTRTSLHRTITLIMVLFISAFSLTASASGTSTPKAPDFAYPKTVAKNASQNLRTALADNNPQLMLRSLLDLTIAKGMISADSLPAVLNTAAGISAKYRGTVQGALVDLIRAELYSDIFMADRYTYSSRTEVVSDTLPADYNLWSAEQFRNRIISLADSVLMQATRLQAVPVTDYSDVITVDKLQRIYFPTLYDFAAYRILLLYKDFYADVQPMPLRLAVSRPSAVIAGKSISETNARILNIYTSLINLHSDSEAPRLMALAKRLDYIYSTSLPLLTSATVPGCIDNILSIYRANSQSQYSAPLLTLLSDMRKRVPDADTVLSDTEMAKLLREYISRNPSYHGIDCIRTMLNNLTAPSVEASAPNIVSRGVPFEIKVTNRNASRYKVSIYKALNQETVNLSGTIASDNLKKELIQTLAVSTPLATPFVTDTAITYTLPDYGVYAIGVTADIPEPFTATGPQYSIVRVSELMISTLTGHATHAIVCNGITGAPVNGADVNLFTRKNSVFQKKLLGHTDHNGFLKVQTQPDRYNYSLLAPQLGSDKYSPAIYTNLRSDYTPWSPADMLRGTLYTDLPLYHQADSVHFTAILYVASKTGTHLFSGQRTRAILYNANSQAIDTLETMTDDWGRASGTFILPKGQLTGQYSINITPITAKTSASTPRSETIAVYFTVSDYKLPTFAITLNPVARNTPSRGSYTISGTVRSYSGINLEGTAITAEIEGYLNPYNSRYDISLFADTIVAGPDGRFSFVLPDSVAKAYGIEPLSYSAQLTATSITGESQTASAYFRPGTAYTIAGNPSYNINAGSPSQLSLKVLSPEGTPVVKDLKVIIKQKGIEKFSGVYPSDEIAIPWRRIHSGAYEITFAGIDIDADSLVSQLVVYRNDDRQSPVDQLLWIPSDNLSIESPRRRFTINYAAAQPDTHILYYLSSSDSIIDYRWLTANSGMHTLDVELPDGIDAATAHLSTVKNYNYVDYQISLAVVDPDDNLELITESFRDNLIPGSPETFTFSTLRGGKGVESAFILSMYNDAINSLISPLDLRFTPRPLINYASIRFNSSRYYLLSSRAEGFVRGNNDCTIYPPVFNTYGHSLFEQTIYFTTRLLGATAGIVESKANAAQSVPTMAEFEAVDEAYDMADAGEAPQPEAQPEASAQASFQYRDAFTPLAFFAPALTSDSNGRLSFSFRVPNANARWYFQAMAYDKSMRSAYKMAQFIANKPVMVQPNLPRFLRHGDKAVVKSLIINNTDHISTIAVTTELFNPSTNRVLFSSDTTLSVAANTQIVIPVDVSAPTDATLLGFRIKATDGQHTDGEQSYLPILPSVTPTIDTYPFYIHADSTQFSMSLPELPDSSRVTLQYCDNPVWYVITALPGLSEGGYKTAPEAAAALFSASVADGLLKKYPRIAEALELWAKSDGSDSTLVSMLSRNSDLKALLLEATPWMQDASNDTQRMQRLLLLLHPDRIKAAREQAITLLTRLHSNGEGWAWIAQYPEPSQWATYSTLTTLGRLRALGFMPSDKSLDRMVKESLRWYEQCTERDYRRYPNGWYADYVELCSLWPSFKQSATGKSLTAKYVQRLVGGWKKLSLSQKVQAATLLQQYGYPRVAKQVMASVMEFAVTTRQGGMCWPSVNERQGDTMAQLLFTARAMSALQAINGSTAASDVNAIAQWLLLQKETRNWGTSITATDIIARILQVTSGWLTTAASPVITLGGRDIAFTPAETMLGEYRTDISSSATPGAILSISGCGNHPSWGAVYAQAIQPMLQVKAADCEAISIAKDIYVRKGDKLVSADTIRVGDRLTVQLTLQVHRDMEYVAIIDDRSAALEPVDQLPGTVWAEGLCFYRESLDSSTRLFINRLPQGTYLLTYDVWANNAGTYTTGIAIVQSQYAPQLTAHSAGSLLSVEP